MTDGTSGVRRILAAADDNPLRAGGLQTQNFGGYPYAFNGS